MVVLVHTTGQEDGLKERRRVSGRNVNFTVRATLKVSVCRYQLTGTANKAERANKHVANKHGENESLNQVDIKGHKNAVGRHADGKLTR